MADCKASKVVVKVKGKGADPLKVCQRIEKKSGRKVKIISPLPNKEEEDDNKQQQQNNDPQPKPANKQEPPPVVTVVLKVGMHCEACAQVMQRRIGKVHGVESVTTEIASDRVIVKSSLDPEKLVNDVYKRTGKHASIVKEEDKKEEEKEEEKQDDKKEAEESKEDEDDKKSEIKKMEHWPSNYYHLEHVYASQFFSDENPHACIVM